MAFRVLIVDGLRYPLNGNERHCKTATNDGVRQETNKAHRIWPAKRAAVVVGNAVGIDPKKDPSVEEDIGAG